MGGDSLADGGYFSAQALSGGLAGNRRHFILWNFFGLLAAAAAASGGSLAAADVAALEVREPLELNSLGVQGRDAWRWLSIPDSRLVLNPFTKVVDGVPPNPDHLSLHSGYFVGAGAVRQADLLFVKMPAGTVFDHAWWPHKLEVSATNRNAGLSVRATDFFADEHTVIRVLDFWGEGKDQPLPVPQIGGLVSGKSSLVDGNVLLADCGGHFFAVSIAVVDSTTRAATGLLPVFELNKGGWTASIPALRSGKSSAVIAVGFATKAEGGVLAAARAREAVLSGPVADSLTQRGQEWKQLLEKVPRPARFGVESRDVVSPERHRLWYYASWSFLLSQLLPPLPENNYPFYSVAEGKPSLWTEGDPVAPAQCSWTCFMVAPLIADFMPEKSWNIYEGIMSRVSPEGELLGECLPSRKAQAAWALYTSSGDRMRLERVYPALKRYLIWREKNPRWIWGAGRGRHDIPDEKDSSFVTSHLIDLECAVHIATALELPDDCEFWRRMIAGELENYRRWFFPEGKDPMNFYFTESKTHVFKDRTKQESGYILSGLAFSGMPEDLSSRLEKFYLKIRKPEEPLLGFEFIKYGESSYIAYGLADRGLKAEGAEFVDRLLVETMRPGGEFGEMMIKRNGVTNVEGVIPSLFLALQTIDFTLMRNGLRIDRAIRQGAANKDLASGEVKAKLSR